MQPLTFKIAIPEDRRISLELPPDIAPGPAEILVVVQPQNDTSISDQFTIADVGWSPTKAAAIRATLASFVDDWDDPRMDIYNAL